MIFFLIIITIIPVIDFSIKFNIINNFEISEEISTFIPFLKIVKVKNYGIAFGFFKNFLYLNILLSLIILLSLVFFVFYKKIRDRQILLAISFIVGGGIGNLLDRFIFGYVIDYLKLTFFSPVCNLSDYFISIGVFIFIIYFLKEKSVKI